jgi:hypothetical protein
MFDDPKANVAILRALAFGTPEKGAIGYVLTVPGCPEEATAE